MQIIDTPYNTVKKLLGLQQSGVSTVIRYYNHSNSSIFPEKRLSLVEAELLTKYGFDIGVVFQQHQRSTEDFNFPKGFAAGRRAYRYARDDINQPPGSCIYFAVDYDASKKELANAIIPFFKGIKEAFTKEESNGVEYSVGAYSSGLVAQTLEDDNLITFTWLTMSTGFLGSSEARRNGRYNLNQQFPSKKLCGLDVDYNLPNSDGRSIGAFRLGHISPEELQNHTTMPQTLYKVTARNGLNIRRGPGTHFDTYSTLSYGTTLYVLSIENNWAKIDLQGDGAIDGYVFAGFIDKYTG